MIIFEKVRWKNILSTGNNFTEIQLNRSPNTLIVGHNGSGKSTILDVLCFGLFNKPFRKVNKPNLLNSINAKNGVVEIEFTIGSKSYKVIRGLKPAIFEIHCDGKLIDQDAASRDYQELLEKQILKLNFKSFTQVVILGSASFVPFMQLSASDRRAIIEDLLDIEIFSTMNAVLKEKLSVNKEALTNVKNDISLTEERIEIQLANIQEHKKFNKDEIVKREEEIVQRKIRLSELNDKVKEIEEQISEIESKIGGKKDTLDKKIQGMYKIETKIEHNIQTIEGEIQFLHDNDNCPTCKQHIPEEFKGERIEEHSKKLEAQKSGLGEVRTEISSISNELKEITSLIGEINQHNDAIRLERNKQYVIADRIKQLNKEITELNVKESAPAQNNDKVVELRDQLKNSLKSYESLLVDKQYLDFAATMLKDTGIKTRIIKQYLPVMNKLINKYLKAMDFFVNFNIDENFEETIKSRHRDEFKYANFSEGEKMRIDLALLFTWRQVAKMKNSVSTNLLILDEVFDSSLDASGTEEFMKLIHEMGIETNLFVISHKGDVLFDKFRSVIKFQKVKNFSQVVK